MSLKESILDAAVGVMARDGYSGLTLDAVAAQAGASKGGLLYHFPSKEALIAGLVNRQLTQFETAMTRHLNAPATPGRWTRAYLRASLESEDGSQADAGQGLIAAVAMDPALLAPLRERYAAWQRALAADGLPKHVALGVRFAVDGIWLCSLLGLGAPSRTELRALLQWLETLTEVAHAA